MSGHKYIRNTGNLFSSEDEIDDETFLKKSGSTDLRHDNVSTSGGSREPDALKMYAERKKDIEEKTLNSTKTSLSILKETEQVGTATADELARQREQLENTRKQLDDINSTLRFSQKHLNGLKSVFGGLKNYLSGQKDSSPRMGNSTSASVSSKIDETTPDRQQEQWGRQPSALNNGDSAKSEMYYTHKENYSIEAMPSGQTKLDQGGSGSSFNSQLDRNLDEMVDSLSRLKGLAINLNQEMDTQNDLIDNITNQVEDVDLKIHKQNRDMNHLLGKK